MQTARTHNGAAQVLPDLAALMGDTQTSEGSVELALNEATATLFRAWSAYAAIDSDVEAKPQVLATAWLNLWRAQTQHAQLVAQFEWPSVKVGREEAIRGADA